MLNFIFEIFTALFVIIDPFAVLPMFVVLTRHDTPQYRRQTATKACAIGAIVLLIFAFGGEWLLDKLGITTPALQLAGGILLMLTAIDMVVAKHSGITSTTPEEEKEAVRKSDVSVFPLAIPLIAGPGAMTAIVMHMREAAGDTTKHMLIVAMMLLVILLTYLCLLFSERLTKILGVTGTNVITRVFGIILAALAMQFVMDGLRVGILSPFMH